MPNTSSLNLTSVQALRDYVEDFNFDLITQGFYGHATSAYSTPHEGVKGKLRLTGLLIGDLATRWAKTFAPADGVLSFKPQTLEVEPIKVELQIFPQDFETVYLGMLRQKGQGMDIPFEGVIMNRIMAKLAQEMDFAHLNAVATSTPQATDLMKNMVDGLGKLLSNIEAAGHAPLGLPSAGFTVDNALDIVNDLITGLGVGYRLGDVQVFMSQKNARIYQNAWPKKYFGAKPRITWEGGVQKTELENGGGNVIVLPSWTSNRIVATPPGNFHHGFDSIADASAFNFLQLHRGIDFWMDFKFGVGIAIPEDSALMFTTA